MAEKSSKIRYSLLWLDPTVNSTENFKASTKTSINNKSFRNIRRY